MTAGSDSHYRSTFDAVKVSVVTWSEFPIVLFYLHYPLIGELSSVYMPRKPGPPPRHSLGGGANTVDVLVQASLAQKKQRPPRTLRQDYAWAPMAVLGGGGRVFF